MQFQYALKQPFKGNTVFLMFLILLCVGCGSTKSKKILSSFENDTFKNQFTGLLIVDTKTKDTIISTNVNKYFIPASTSKIFTFYTSKKLLPSRIPTLKYVETRDSLFIEGTGDPTWLHPYFMDSTAINFLSKTNKPIAIHLENFGDDVYKPGWAWEDYQYYFSPELGALPLYGNVVTLSDVTSISTVPKKFINVVRKEKPNTLRHRFKNEFYIPNRIKDTLQIPFSTSKNLTKQLLEDILKRKIYFSDKPLKKPKEILYGIATDSIIKRMLQESDNFLAEQLMNASAATISDTLSFNSTKNKILNEYLQKLRQKPRWVDGSGLSRYNLFTPESMTYVLQELYKDLETEYLFKIMPRWNSNGTIKQNNLKESSFIIAKSGSMGNTYNLCGYLRTKSGCIFTFSFMNNHFRIPSKQVRNNIYTVLKDIHAKY